MTVRFAWSTLLEPVDVDITAVSVDGAPLAPELVDPDHGRVHLEAAEGWSELCLEVVAGPSTTPPDEMGPLSAYVLVECGATNTRIPVALTGDPWSARVVLDRDEVDNRFSLRVEVVAEIDDRLRTVGSSPEWTVVLDAAAAPVPPGVPPFETLWVDFGAPDAPPAARRMPEAHAYMDLQDTPRLLLNSGVDGYQHLLHADSARLERRRLRDLLGADVARYALTTMFRAAAAEVLVDDGLVTPPERALYRQVCEAVAERTPGIGSVDELYERLVSARDSAAETLDLWGAVDLAISSLTGVDSALSIACAEVKHG